MEPGFRVGIPDLAREQMEGNRRYFYWQILPGDHVVSDLAGWKNLPYEEHADGRVGRLELPLGLRSASSALGGMEAWQGEKDEILAAMSSYARDLHERHGYVDTHLQLDTFGVTRGNEQLLMVPPHNLASPESEIAQRWHEGLVADVEAVLEADPRKEELVSRFRAGLPAVGGAQ
jgi:hypothetical protein